MKNKNIKFTILVIFAAGAIVLTYVSYALAWGSLTHMGLIVEAAKKETPPVAKEYMSAFIAGATEPDIGAMESGASSVSEEYHIYHDPVFAEAMMKVADTKKSPEREILKARAAGYLMHLKGDSVSHTKEGYSNAKDVYASVKHGDKANHLTTEMLVDTLVYAKNKKALNKYGANFIDAETLLAVRNEYAKIKGIELKSDIKKLKTDILKHRAIVVSSETIAESMAKNPALMKQIDERFKDRFDGLNDHGGLNKSVDLIAASFKNGELTKIEKLKDQRGLLEKTGNFAMNIVNAAAEGGAELTEKALLNFAKIDFIRNKAEGLVNSKLKGNEIILAKLVLSATSDGGISLNEALYNAESAAADMSKSAIKLKMTALNVKILKEKADAAYAEYKNRPWWKFWLKFTNSDRKKFEKLNAEYLAKKAELEQLEKTAILNAANTAANASTAAAASTNGNSGPGAELKAAHEAMLAAFEDFKKAGAPSSGREFEKYRSACEAYEKLVNKQ